MPTRECDLNNRPNKTSRYRDAPARTMPSLFARTLRPLNRICRNARAPLAESDFLADRIAFIQSNKVIQQLKASNDYLYDQFGRRIASKTLYMALYVVACS